MRVLITGVSGFIGGHLLKTAPPEVEITGTYLHHPIPSAACRLYRLDLRNQPLFFALLTLLQPDLIIHSAAYARVAFCEKRPRAVYQLNTQVTVQVANWCSESGIRLIFLSSDMVFAGDKGNYCESDDPMPLNFYGWSKLIAETFVRQAQLRGIILRVNLTYGKPAYGGTSFSEEVINTVSAGKSYALFSDQRRSPISVQNLARVIWELAKSDFNGVLHLGGTDSVDRYTFALQLAQRVGLDQNLLIRSTMQAQASGVQQPADNTFQLDRAHAILKTPLWGLEEGLRREYP